MLKCEHFFSILTLMSMIHYISVQLSMKKVYNLGSVHEFLELFEYATVNFSNIHIQLSSEARGLNRTRTFNLAPPLTFATPLLLIHLRIERQFFSCA